MPNELFEKLLNEMPKIAKAVNLFASEKVQEQACEALLRSLRGEGKANEADTRKGEAEPKAEPKVAKKGGRSTHERKTAKRPASSDTFSIVSDLNLQPKSGESLREFVKAKVPKTNEEHFAVMVYYMQQRLKVTKITPNHIYTCFKDVGKKVPAQLKTVLSNAARRKGWFISQVEGLKLTTPGENYVEHDLPPKKTK